MKRNKHYQNTLPFFYKIYNVSAMKMHQLAQHVGGCVRGIFTDTIIVENPTKPPFLSTEIGGVRNSKIPKSDLLLNTFPRTKNFIHEKPEKKVLQNIDEFKLKDNKGCCILGMAGTGKSTLCKKLQQELGINKYQVGAPTHKAALLIGAVTVYNLFNICPKTHTYLKSTVEKLKSSGVEWIFVDEISMVNSKIWAVLNDIKKKYNFKFVLLGDFAQLPAVEKFKYNVKDSELFAELVDCQLLELTKNYRAMNDPEFKIFLNDMMTIREGGQINFNKYGKKDCRKSICWTNRTRKAINQKWNLKESQNVKYITLKHMRVYKSLPIICKKTTTINDKQVRNKPLQSKTLCCVCFDFVDN
jgi:GTPase SAR1 family protein